MIELILPAVLWLGTVTRVLDGDTIEVTRKTATLNEEEAMSRSHRYAKSAKNDDSSPTPKPTLVRLARIDAPELSQEGGESSRKFLSSLIEDKVVDVKKSTTDRYGRTVAEINQNGQNINARMVLEGQAWHYIEYAPGDTTLKMLQEYARMKKHGLWKHEEPVPPWEFRKKQKQEISNCET